MGKTTPIDAETAAILALMCIPGIGRVAVREVAHAARVAGTSLAALLDTTPESAAALVPVGFGRVLEALDGRRRPALARAGWTLRRLTSTGVCVLSFNDEAYPASLSRSLAKTTPPLLFVRGDPELLEEPAVAVVGARAASKQGLALARQCARTFSEAGTPVVVVSGGASGVDSSAHDGALESGGKTIVVLPQGILTYRPPAFVGRAIAAGRATLVSEFMPDAPWETHAAVTRNATISGLARMVCVIDPRKMGGSMCTARHGFAQGKRVVVNCHDTAGLAARYLRHAGALDLLDEAGRFDPERLLEFWRTAPEPRVGQECLF